MNSMAGVRVVIDLDRVAHNLRPADGGEADMGMAKAFLRQVGFNSGEDGTWVGTRAGLQRLNYSEIVRVEPLG